MGQCDNANEYASDIFGENIETNAPKQCLQRTSLLLAHCVKKSWADTWNVKLDDPPEFPCTNESFDDVKRCAAAPTKR